MEHSCHNIWRINREVGFQGCFKNPMVCLFGGIFEMVGGVSLGL